MARAGLDDEAAEEEALAEEAQQARTPRAARIAFAFAFCARSAPRHVATDLPRCQAREAADTLPSQVSALMAEVAAARARTEAAQQGTSPSFGLVHFFSTQLLMTRPLLATQLLRAALRAPTRS